LKSKDDLLKSFDPNGIGLRNGHFIGLPFGPEQADLYLLGVPWDVTVSFAEGTSSGAKNILEASPQLDLFDEDFPGAWKRGIYLDAHPEQMGKGGAKMRKRAKLYIDHLESGATDRSDHFAQELNEINTACAAMVNRVANRTAELLDMGKKVGLIGGDHSTPLGYLKTLADRHDDFGILQIDAHMDLRVAYEGFTYSHASIFHNALQLSSISKLVQVGIRDFCDAEWHVAQSDSRIDTHTMSRIREKKFEGTNWSSYVDQLIATLPQKVYISFDIDGLDPKLCPNTGTPVPGGLEFHEVTFLIKRLVASGKEIIGFDLSEVAGLGNDWDGNVGARILYKLCGAILS